VDFCIFPDLTALCVELALPTGGCDGSLCWNSPCVSAFAWDTDKLFGDFDPD